MYPFNGCAPKVPECPTSVRSEKAYKYISMDNIQHLAQVIFILSPDSSLNLYALEDTPQDIFTLARDS